MQQGVQEGCIVWVRRRSRGLWLLSLMGALLGGCTRLHPTNAVLDVSQQQGAIPLTLSYDACVFEGQDDTTTYRWASCASAEFHFVGV